MKIVFKRGDGKESYSAYNLNSNDLQTKHRNGIKLKDQYYL